MTALFVDTGAWYAIMNREDAHHSEAVDFLSGTSRLLLTTNYVVVETVNLLNARVGHGPAARFLERLHSSKIATVHHISPSEHSEAETFFVAHRDKDFSLADCSSFVVMKELGLTDAFTFDRHFAQAGFARVP